MQLIDTPAKVYAAIVARLFLSKVPLEVLQNWILIQLIVTPHILGKVQGQIKEVYRLIEPCLLIGTREYMLLPKTAEIQVVLNKTANCENKNQSKFVTLPDGLEVSTTIPTF